MPATAVKQEMVTPRIEPKPTWRFAQPDFDAIGPWLLGELRERFPAMTERNVMGWLRGVMQSPEFLFIRNDKAALLAQIVHEAMDPRPVVVEVFCLAQDGGMQHAAALYTDMKRWAQGMDAKHLMVEEFTDVPRPMIVEALGQPVEIEKITIARLKSTNPT